MNGISLSAGVEPTVLVLTNTRLFAVSTKARCDLSVVSTSVQQTGAEYQKDEDQFTYVCPTALSVSEEIQPAHSPDAVSTVGVPELGMRQDSSPSFPPFELKGTPLNVAAINRVS